jgi:isoleucyl-tRNA synthetase
MTVNEREQAVLKRWREEGTFAASLEKTQEGEEYSFFDGPPFATGLPHYGHILASVSKDLVGRFWTMQGQSVPRRWGWDCHGLPIENIVEKELGISGKKQIEERGVEHFNEACRRNVLTYADEWSKTVERIGRWVDFSGSYKTMDSTYMESVWWALKQLWEKELIYQGQKVLLYCPRCETPISNFEVAMDDSYETVTDDTVVVGFKVTSGDWAGAQVLAWTTTPWTLPANVALAVGPDITYALVTQGKNKYVVASDRTEPILQEGFEIVEVKTGAEMKGWTYEPLFGSAGENAHQVVTADFVTLESGTGVVHIAPAYGEDDFNLAKEASLPVLSVLNEQGRYLESAPIGLAGVYHKDGNAIVTEALEKAGQLYRVIPHQHEYPFCWRCRTPLYYNAIPAWFINIQKIKPRLIELNEQIAWHPDHLKHGRFLNVLESAPDWNISRNRYWATALPFWVCDCGQTDCIGSLAELKERALNYDEVFQSDDIKDVDLHKPQVDRIKIKCEKCGKSMTRVPEVLDCWFESGSMPFAEWHYPFDNKQKVEDRLPGDFVSEYIAQTRAWFYYMHVLSTILFDQAPFKHVVTTGTILNESGQKMSKSLNNFPDPNKLIEQYGVDALRLQLMTSVVMKGENLLFAEREVQEMYRRVIQLWYNVGSFFELHADKLKDAAASDHVLDRWMIARLKSFVADSTTQYQAYNLTDAARLVRGLVEDVSTWYVRRSRDRFKEGDTAGLATFQTVLRTTAQVMAPLLPFMAEETWQTAGGEGSVHLTDWPKLEPLTTAEQQLLTDMAVVQQAASNLLSLRVKAGLKVRQTLRQAAISQTLSDELRQVLADEVNVLSVVVNESLKKDGEEVAVSLDTELDDELRRLGLERELTRTLAEKRKVAGLQVGEAAVVRYNTDDAELQAVIPTDWVKDDSVADEVEVDGHTLRLTVNV